MNVRASNHASWLILNEYQSILFVYRAFTNLIRNIFQATILLCDRSEGERNMYPNLVSGVSFHMPGSTCYNV